MTEGFLVGEFVRGLILASAGGVAGVPTVAKVAKGAVIVISIPLTLAILARPRARSIVARRNSRSESSIVLSRASCPRSASTA